MTTHARRCATRGCVAIKYKLCLRGIPARARRAPRTDAANARKPDPQNLDMGVVRTGPSRNAGTCAARRDHTDLVGAAIPEIRGPLGREVSNTRCDISREPPCTLRGAGRGVTDADSPSDLVRGALKA